MDLLVGYGNTARRDDGAGPSLAGAFLRESRMGLKVMVTQQLGPELALEFSQYQRVILADASEGGPPLLLQRLDPAAGAAPPTTHHTGPQALLLLAKTLYKAEPLLYLCTIKGEDFGYGFGMSALVESRVAQAKHLVDQLLNHAQEAADA
jgi:hydrogenase maturation protease